MRHRVGLSIGGNKNQQMDAYKKAKNKSNEEDLPRNSEVFESLKNYNRGKIFTVTSVAQLASTQYIIAMSIIVCSYQNI